MIRHSTATRHSAAVVVAAVAEAIRGRALRAATRDGKGAAGEAPPPGCQSLNAPRVALLQNDLADYAGAVSGLEAKGPLEDNCVKVRHGAR